MRKKLTAIFSSILFCLILICGSLELISCSNNSAQETEISFSIPENVVRQAISRAPERNENVTISVKLFNSNEEKEIKSFAVSKDVEEWDLFFNDKIASNEGYKVTFEEVPLGITVYAEVSIYFEMEKIIEEIYHGRSEELEVQAGVNQIPVVLEDVGEPGTPKLQIQFLFQKELESENYLQNDDFPAITIDFSEDYENSLQQAILEYVSKIEKLGYTLNEMLSDSEPVMNDDGSYSMSLYYDIVDTRVHINSSITIPEYDLPTIQLNKSEVFVDGDTIRLSAVTKNNEEIIDVTYNAKIYYAGVDIGTEYYTLTDDEVIINTLEVAGIYQLFVTASYNYEGEYPVTASQTFNLNVSFPTTLYVDENGSDDNSGISATQALASLDAADKLIDYYAYKNSQLLDWTIYVKGTISGAQQIITKKAKSITIEGTSEPVDDEPQDVINANADEENKATALTVTNCAPIIVRNLKITGGYSSYYGAGIYAEGISLTIDKVLITGNHSEGNGGGIYISGRGVLYMCDSTINGNEAKTSGGGIYSSYSDIYMYGDSVIGDRDAEGSAVYAGVNGANNSYGNISLQTGSSNYNGGGGIFTSGTLYMGYSGKDEYGELIECELTGGIYHNYSCCDGGGVLYYSSSDSKIKMNSGTIANNSSTNGKGKGVFLYHESGAIFYIGGDAFINSNDWVYIYNRGSHFFVEKEFTNDITINIRPEYNTTNSYVILEAADNLNFSEIKNHFAIVGFSGYTIDENGKLKRE